MIIETAYDKFHEVVTTALQAHGATLTDAVVYKELHDNLVIENNDAKFLEKGYSVRFVSDTGLDTELSCLTRIDHTVEVVYTTANYGTIRDIPLRKAAEKRLLAMKDAVLKAIGGNPQLDDTVAKCIYNGSDSIELIVDDNEKVFLMLRSTYTIGYFEQSPQ